MAAADMQYDEDDGNRGAGGKYQSQIVDGVLLIRIIT